ncbi:hypothetical protein H257_00832 [Aphanomyces astaci]|uniref:Geranylgeranyl transferase type-2 subunit alpha n=1 Tax=Aphanomyces astaci TaxID=112090 RepID=W4HE98_APHAT|nr:hypothetical protein H257_00832 [Aphanomyces astaci]ETV89624.1 hypothetical protein H257_00832 [Aphanomyces astaci]|eukprot:XP_009822024.1 hypothetical protein H257_00832 [Aphanomyces astaci]
MHGIRKSDVAKSPEEEAKIEEHVRKYKEVSSQVMALKKAQQFDDHALRLSAVVVVLNPEFWIVWAFRRDVLRHLLEADGSRKSELGEAECKLTMEALMKNPKSYSAWFQRQWIIDNGMADISKEVRLCDALLDKDERNFHCWNYRRYLSKLAGTHDDLLELCDRKINQNFSNYSALHQRTLSLPTPLPLAVLLNEVEVVKQAVFTEPYDQSNWFYYRWLLQAMPRGESSAWLNEIAWIEELLQEEPNAKLAWVTLAFVLESSNDADSAAARTARCRHIYTTLIDMDIDHKHYYTDQLRRLVE